jgi:catechol 2,3-dioxygenase-like lactoylglutathione lyase family enzyme
LSERWNIALRLIGKFLMTETARPPASAPDVTATFLVEQAFAPSLARRRQMNLQKIYTALLTADLAAAEGWYTKLLGRGPDYRPMDTLVQWELFDQGGVALSTDDDIAGRGVMFLLVDDVAAERRRLQGLGIVLGDDIEGDYSTLAQVRDPDGNLLTLATPPSRPYPPA